MIQELEFDLRGDWRKYANSLPLNSIALGTVVRDGEELGALVKLHNGRYIEYCHGGQRSLPQHRVKEFLCSIDGRRRKQPRLVDVNVRLTTKQLDYILLQSDLRNISQAEFIRQCIDWSIDTE